MGLKKNIFYSAVLTTANYIFPLITFPYISRVLGVANIGICDFVDSVINYFSLFAMMGINTVAVREIANCKDDKCELSKTFSSLLCLNTISTLLVILILISLIFAVPEFYKYRNMMFIGVFKLLFNTFLIEWLYKGLENFRFITIRSVCIRCLYVVCVFVFVKSPNDYVVYYILMTLTIIVNSTINLYYSKSFICFSFKDINFKKYLKPFIILGFYGLLTSFYTTFNTLYLGLQWNNVEVGYYSTATKLHSIILAMFSAFTGVMMPRMSALVSEGKKDSFKVLFDKSVNALFIFALPILCLSIIFADQIIICIAGHEFLPAVHCMRIILPLIFIVGYEQVLVYQILMPLKRDREILINSIIGAFVGVVTNIIFVPLYGSIGSSLVWILSELSILFLAQFFVTKIAGLTFPYKKLFKYSFVMFPLVVALIFIHEWNPLQTITLLFAGILTILYFVVIELFFIKDELIFSIFFEIRNKLFNGR